MTREIVREEPLSLASISALPKPIAADEYKDRLLKYIPADVIAIYITLTSITAATSRSGHQWWLACIVFATIAVCTPFYMRSVGGISDIKQIVVGTLAFVIWAASLGAPFDVDHIGWWDPVIPALLLPFYTFLIPLTDRSFTPGSPGTQAHLRG